ncbi:MAG: methionine biosynthesis protein MetW [Devosiaceae bacterium]|nr:methionine biosynthesis protein MetW [Devosiaceae bacterium MH13]
MSVPLSRVDYAIIEHYVPQGARVLDVGCEDGNLLAFLEQKKAIDGRGLELSQANVNAAVARGLSVIQGDADTDLSTYPDGAFDVVILSQTLQATQAPRKVLEELLRIGKRVIVAIPNFGHWKARLHLLLRGEMPVTKSLPYSWYDTPNIHFCTLRDFVHLTEAVGATIEDSAALNAQGQRVALHAPWALWNLVGAQGIFVLRPGNGPDAQATS